jgi:hypothetical protein
MAATVQPLTSAIVAIADRLNKLPPGAVPANVRTEVDQLLTFLGTPSSPQSDGGFFNISGIQVPRILVRDPSTKLSILPAGAIRDVQSALPNSGT